MGATINRGLAQPLTLSNNFRSPLICGIVYSISLNVDAPTINNLFNLLSGLIYVEPISDFKTSSRVIFTPSFIGIDSTLILPKS